MIFLNNTSIGFKELNEFIDRKNLDDIGCFLIDTKALNLQKTKNLLAKHIDRLTMDVFDKVRFILFEI